MSLSRKLFVKAVTANLQAKATIVRHALSNPAMNVFIYGAAYVSGLLVWLSGTAQCAFVVCGAVG
jgi:hypothetical protein